MELNTFFSFLVLSISLLHSVAGKECYNCGYRKQGEESVALPDSDFCGDFATPEDIVTTCGVESDCCASLKEYFIKVDEETGENSTVIIGRHGCESEMDHLGEFSAVCSEHKNSCYNVEQSSLGDHTHENVTITDAEICFCDADRCNTDDPIPPIPETTAGSDTTKPSGPTKTCYNCGYMARTMSGDMAEIEEIEGYAFCKDQATMESMTKQCGNGDECCGSLREYFIRTEEDGSEIIDMRAIHGCEQDLANIGKFGVICDQHTNSCYNISRDNMGDSTATFAKACFCEGDRCNNDIPTLPDPDVTTTAAPSVASPTKIFSSILAVIFSAIVLSTTINLH